MAIVVDANIVTVLVTPDPRTLLAERQLLAWLTSGETLHAPDLLVYEVASALMRLVVAGRLKRDDLRPAWNLVARIPLQLHRMGAGLDVVTTALDLGRQSAYDAAYLVLAQQLGVELWTLDGPLVRNASGIGFPVRLLVQ